MIITLVSAATWIEAKSAFAQSRDLSDSGRVFVLREGFSGLVAIQPGHRLVTGGIYGVIRHPSYLGLIIRSLGWALAFNSWVAVLLAALLVPPVVARIRAEERLLGSHFGDEYAAYRARASRVIPGIY